MYDRTAHAAFMRGLDADAQARAVELKSRVVVPGMDTAIAQPQAQGHVYVQFHHVLDAAGRGRLLEMGAQVREYVDNRTYVVDCAAGVAQQVLGDPLVAGVAAVWPADKVPPGVGTRVWSAAATESSSVTRYRLRLYDGVPVSDVMPALLARGISLSVEEFGAGVVLEGELTDAQVRAAAGIDAMAAIDLAPPPRQIDNANAQVYSRAADAQAPPFGLDGTGITVLVRDENFAGHADYNARLTTLAFNSGAPQSTHHTHVTGTVGGDGTGDGAAEGMAPAVELVTHEFNGNDTTEIRDPFLDHGARLSNHSYGIPNGWEDGGISFYSYPGFEFGNYNILSNEWDALVYNYDLIICKAAGNDRNDVDTNRPHYHFPGDSGANPPGHTDSHPNDGPYNCINEAGLSKNVITVGAVNHDDTMSTFSSVGPGDDGRVKPDVVTDGVLLRSTVTNNGYGFLSGTSMATPTTTGSLALFLQHYRANYGGGATEPGAALTKACLIHGARDLTSSHGGGGSGYYQVGPDYGSGWGAVDIVNSITAIPLAQTGAVANGETDTFTVNVEGTDTPLKATLVWIDPPGNTSAVNSIINDLDLQVEAPDATVHFPWVLDRDNPGTPATTGVNTVDVTEQVVVDTPQLGTYTITVSGTSVPLGPQDYVLIISADTPATGVTLAPSVGSPQVEGSSITWNARGLGGTGAYDYRFFLLGPGTGGVWTAVQGYGNGDSWTWTPSAADAGRNYVAAWVRNIDSSAPMEARSASIPFEVTPDVLTVNLSASPASPQAAGTTITWTAQGQGGSGSYEYRFFQLGPATGGVWTGVQGYGGGTYTWNPTAADEGVTYFAVWMRNQGSTAPFEARSASVPFRISPPPATGATLSPSPASPAAAGTTVTWTAEGEGGSGNYEYRFFQLGPATGGVWAPVQAYGGGNTFTWNTSGADIGTNYFAVWVRSQGSTAPFEARSGSVPYTVTAPLS